LPARQSHPPCSASSIADRPSRGIDMRNFGSSRTVDRMRQPTVDLIDYPPNRAAHFPARRRLFVKAWFKESSLCG
jgi:hypothetical protein